MIRCAKHWMVAAAAGALLLGSASSAWARQYYLVADWATINPGFTSTNFSGGAFSEGRTLYSNLSTPGKITKVSNLTQTLDGNTAGEVYSLLTSNAELSAAGAGISAEPPSGTTNSLIAIYGFSSGRGSASNYIQFSESSSDAVFRIDKTTGAISKYASRSQMQTALGVSSVALLAPNDSTPDGEFVTFDSSIGFIKTAGAGNAVVYISAAALTTATGTNSMAGGVTYDAAGNFYFAANNSTTSQRAIYKMTPGGVISQILTAPQIQAVSGGSGITWRDIFAAPDGKIYFSDGSSQGILRFDPANPLGTLENYLTSADLIAGLAGGSGSAAVSTLSWYDNGVGQYGIAFNFFQSTGSKGYFFVPEPGSLGLLGLGGLLLARRRRTA